MPINTIYDCYGNAVVIEKEEFTISPLKYSVLEKDKHFRTYISSKFSYNYDKVRNCPFFGNYIDIHLNNGVYEVLVYESPMFNIKYSKRFKKLFLAKKFIEEYVWKEYLKTF